MRSHAAERTGRRDRGTNRSPPPTQTARRRPSRHRTAPEIQSARRPTRSSKGDIADGDGASRRHRTFPAEFEIEACPDRLPQRESDVAMRSRSARLEIISERRLGNRQLQDGANSAVASSTSLEQIGEFRRGLGGQLFVALHELRRVRSTPRRCTRAAARPTPTQAARRCDSPPASRWDNCVC